MPALFFCAKGPMLLLKKMSEEAYERFTALSMKDFAEAKARAERLSVEEGQRIADSAWKSLLPQGQETETHHFFSAFRDNIEIGMLWFKEERNWETPYGYLYQVWVWDEFQGQGLGRELMKALETELLSRGLKRLRLHVFAFNERAVKLYESMGFETTNLVMVKELK